MSEIRKNGRVSHAVVCRVLGLGVSAIALNAAPAMAQQSGKDTGTTLSQSDTDAIVVTGLRAAQMSAILTKRNAEVIVDSISAQDIGALPDRSVSEALQRIPGVTLQRTNENRDPARLSAEGGGIFIRGLSWVRSEFNGRDIFSANSGRGLSFEDVSADLLAGVDVYKNPSADMIEGGVGGLVNLRTRKPLDERGQIIALSGDYNYADLRKKGFWSGNALYSNRWQLGGGEIGLLLSGSIGNIGNRTDSIQTGNYVSHELTTALGGLPAGTTVYTPQSLGWRRIDWQQRRTAFDGVLQLRPDPSMTFTFEAFFARTTPKDIEHADGIYQLPTEGADYQFDKDNVLVSGSYPFANMDLDTRYGKQRKDTRDFSINWEWQASDHLKITVDAQRVWSQAKILSFTAFTEFGIAPGSFNAQRPNISFDLSGNSPSISVDDNGVALDDKSAYWWAAAMDHIEHNTAGSWAERADLEYTFDEGSFLKSFRFGGRLTDKEAITRQTGYNWSLLSQQYWGGADPVYLDGTGSPANSGLPDQSELFTYNNFFRGNIAVPGVGWFPSAALMTGGTANAYQYLKSTETSGWGWTPLTSDSYTTAVPGSDNPSSGISVQNEKTLAAYGLLRFGTPTTGAGTFDGSIGVRWVRTRNTATGQLIVNPLQGAVTPADCLAANPSNTAACDPLIQAITFIGNGASGSPYKYRNHYDDWLPSLNLRYMITDAMMLRFAASKAIVRPSFQQMVPYNTLSFSFQQNGYTPALTNALTGQGGNPYLKPTKADQLDLSWEWYFAPGGQLSVGAFYKHIKDYIFSGVSKETYTRNGETVTFDVTRNMNGDKGSIKGFEIAYEQFYGFLPGPLAGLGFQGNFTYVDSNGGQNTAVNSLDPNQRANAGDASLPLEGMSKYSFNAAVLYEKYGFSARFAYNWRSRYLLTTSAANLNAPVWSNAYGQLDGSIIYDVTRNVKIGVQATNILRAKTYLDVGGAALSSRYSWSTTDRRVAFVVRTRF